MKNSINRAIALISTPADLESYISIKIRPSEGGCCCFHCWPKTWEDINEYILPYGPLKDEGDVVVNKDAERFVLQCHESGPEIIIYLGLGTALISITNSVINLITTLLKDRQREIGKHGVAFKILTRWYRKEKVVEEVIMELNLPLTDEIVKKLNKKIQESIDTKIKNRNKN